MSEIGAELTFECLIEGEVERVEMADLRLQLKPRTCLLSVFADLRRPIVTLVQQFAKSNPKRSSVVVESQTENF